MTTPQELRDIAHQLQSAQDEVRQFEPLTAQRHGFDVDAAYAVAHLIHEARQAAGAIPVGRKVGFTNASLWPVYDVHEPIWGHVYDTTVVNVPTGEATCRIARFAEPKIEPEIILHFRTAPPVDGDAAAILACVDWIAHGFEIVQSAYPGWKFKVADTIANSAMHATLLVGAPQPVERLGTGLLGKQEQFVVRLLCDGRLADTGKGANVLGSPLAAVAHLLGVLARQPQYPPLGANEIVTTGSLTAALPIKPGETWCTELDGIALPGLAVTFVA